ncbi:hypothetical protein ACG33_06095 [Steroidobacter denitrificans]|uniref:5-formyltetrahydrofolate cyclo-ligase n=2 Tax=Steroidobacter denitrificans TaxID=465721 RepID=A0A127F8B8_STEDE|nr:hypothetical protein ACG33_06095 [Steroidobacter denitrificans]
MRARRRQLSRAQRTAAARHFARHLAPLLRPGKRIALYLPHDAEADPGVIIHRARQRGCTLYLPCITHYRRSRMRFLRFDQDTRLRTNRYGIREPDPAHAPDIAVRLLDLVLLPLIAFDDYGGRLGSGAGFYDRHLHHLCRQRQWRRPRLIGLAYEFQRVTHLKSAPWDVPMDGVVTPLGLHTPRRAVSKHGDPC